SGGLTPPFDWRVKVAPQPDAQIVTDPPATFFYEPIRNLPKDFDAATRRTITEKYIRAIDTQVVPAYRRLRTFVYDEDLPRCRTTGGIADLPGGGAVDAFAVRMGTATNMTAGESSA